MSTPPVKLPEILEKMADLGLAHRPKAVTKAGKKRKRASLSLSHDKTSDAKGKKQK